MHRRHNIETMPIPGGAGAKGFLWPLLLSLLVTVASCGGGGGGGGGAASGQVAISGSAGGPVAAGTIIAHPVNLLGTVGSTVLATAQTDANGNYSLAINNYSGSLYLEATGGSYIDVATAKTVAIPATPGSGLRAVVNLGTGTGLKVQLTPLTTIAEVLAAAFPGGLTANNIDAANRRVGSYFRFDILTTQPINPGVAGAAAGASQAAIDYALVLAGISKEAQAIQLTNAFDLVPALAQDFSDGSFNGRVGSTPVQLEGAPLDPAAGTTGLASAITAFSGSPQNASGAAASETLLDFLANPPASYTVGGTISNLSGALGLDDNDFDPFTVTGTGTSTAFTFPTPIAVGNTYSVTVTSQPPGLTCTVSNGSGTMGIAPVTDVAIGCVAARVPVPDVTHKSKTNAENILRSVGLLVGTELQSFSETEPEGQVISQNPAAGLNVTAAYGSKVNLVISLGPQSATIPVPGVVGLTKLAAEQAISTALLHVGTETLGFDRTVPEGSVVSQTCTVGSLINPNCPGGTLVPPDAFVNLLISNGPAFVPIPSFSNTLEKTAEGVLAGADLVVGTITPGSDPTKPFGTVIGQDPIGGNGGTVRQGDAINLTVNTLLPDFTGQSQTNAEGNIQNALGPAFGLVVTVTQASSATVPAGSVISQDPVTGTEIAPGSTLTLVVSTGP